MTDEVHLTDEQIAAHEAGHALVAHLLGEAIREVQMYTGAHSARVVLTEPVRAEQIRFGGTIGEMIGGFAASPTNACSDMNGIDPATPRAEPGALTLLNRHVSSHRQLSNLLLDARRERRVIPGEEAHRYLEDLGCPLGCEVSATNPSRRFRTQPAPGPAV